MKNIFKSVLLSLLAVVAVGSLNSCRDADPEFVHTDNIIKQLFMMTELQGTQYAFTIDEYDAQGNLVTGEITEEKVAGGYGIAHIEFPITQADAIDLTNVFVVAHVGYDVIITPGLQGRHNIAATDENGNLIGMVINAKAGSGKVRKYRVYGTFN